MADAKTVLIGVSASLGEEFREHAASRGIGIVAAPDVDSLGEMVGSACLCIVASTGDDGTASAVRSLSRRLRGVPVVVLDRDLGSSAIVRLARMGVADVLDADREPDDLIVRAHAHRTPIQDEADWVVGDSAYARALRCRVETVAAAESTVLITGETGTGKGLVAREIHRRSCRSGEPFVHVDGSSLAPSVFESELFGHERGAFTSASSRRQGRFELAGSGTIFLDEIGELDPSLQVKLLRVLQDRVFERVGGGRTLEMKARVIAATNRELDDALQDGTFRSDLYYRLNVLHIRMPPLRERLEDIPVLVDAHLRVLVERVGVERPSVAPSFLEALANHAWPGNVRELRNVLERCLIEARKERLEASDLEGILVPNPPPARLGPAPERERGRLRRRAIERLVGTSKGIALVREQIRQAAPHRLRVLVTGETGAGKGLVARAIHEESRRHPFVEICVADLPEELLDLELFGQEANTIDPTAPPRVGMFERAHGGTLFLDEIGEAPPGLQRRILRALETAEVQRRGGGPPRVVDVRVVAASQHDLAGLVRAGGFREDLYYRLQESEIRLPPLRERLEDIVPLSEMLLAELCAETKRPVPELGSGVFTVLRNHPFRGNVRELRSHLRSLLIGWDGTAALTECDMVRHMAALTPGLTTEQITDSLRMVHAYRSCNGNQEAARRELGLSRGEWRHRWSSYGLDLLRRRR